MKILINYADRKFYESQKKNSMTGLNVGGFDKVIQYSRKDIDPEFCNKNKHIINYPKGAGYWIWKPYIILKTLENTKEGDYIFYCDAGSHFVNSIDHLIKQMEQDIMPFE